MLYQKLKWKSKTKKWKDNNPTKIRKRMITAWTPVFHPANHRYAPMTARIKGESIEDVAPSESQHRPGMAHLKRAKMQNNHPLEVMVNRPKGPMGAEGGGVARNHHRIKDTIKCAALLEDSNRAGVAVAAIRKAFEIIEAGIVSKRGVEAHLHLALHGRM